eukprot:gene16240-22408_t
MAPHLDPAEARVPAHEFRGVSNNGSTKFFRGQVMRKDPEHDGCVVVSFPDGALFYWPADRVRPWVQDALAQLPDQIAADNGMSQGAMKGPLHGGAWREEYTSEGQQPAVSRRKLTARSLGSEQPLSLKQSRQSVNRDGNGQASGGVHSMDEGATSGSEDGAEYDASISNCLLEGLGEGIQPCRPCDAAPPPCDGVNAAKGTRTVSYMPSGIPTGPHAAAQVAHGVHAPFDNNNFHVRNGYHAAIISKSANDIQQVGQLSRSKGFGATGAAPLSNGSIATQQPLRLNRGDPLEQPSRSNRGSPAHTLPVHDRHLGSGIGSSHASALIHEGMPAGVRLPSGGLHPSGLPSRPLPTARLHASGLPSRPLPSAGFHPARSQSAGFPPARAQSAGFPPARAHSAGFRSASTQSAGFRPVSTQCDSKGQIDMSGPAPYAVFGAKGGAPPTIQPSPSALDINMMVGPISASALSGPATKPSPNSLSTLSTPMVQHWMQQQLRNEVRQRTLQQHWPLHTPMYCPPVAGWHAGRSLLARQTESSPRDIDVDQLVSINLVSPLPRPIWRQAPFSVAVDDGAARANTPPPERSIKQSVSPQTLQRTSRHTRGIEEPAGTRSRDGGGEGSGGGAVKPPPARESGQEKEDAAGSNRGGSAPSTTAMAYRRPSFVNRWKASATSNSVK